MRYKRRMNPERKRISADAARKWVRQTLEIDGSAPYPGKIGPALKAHLGWAFHVTFHNAKWGKQKGFGSEFDRWYLVGVDKDGHQFLQLTRPEAIFGLQKSNPASVTPRQAQDAAEKLGYYRTAEIVGPGGLSGASMAALVRLVREAGQHRNPARRVPTWVASALKAGATVHEGGAHGFWSVVRGQRWLSDADTPRGKLSYGDNFDEEPNDIGEMPSAKALAWLAGKKNPRENPSRWQVEFWNHGAQIPGRVVGGFVSEASAKAYVQRQEEEFKTRGWGAIRLEIHPETTATAATRRNPRRSRR